MKNVLSITNTFSLVLHTDKKDFGVIRKAMNSTITIFTIMAIIQNSIQNEVLMEMNTCTDCNIVAKVALKRARIDLTVKPNKFSLKICQPFHFKDLPSLHRYVEYSVAKP